MIQKQKTNINSDNRPHHHHTRREVSSGRATPHRRVSNPPVSSTAHPPGGPLTTAANLLALRPPRAPQLTGRGVFLEKGTTSKLRLGVAEATAPQTSTNAFLKIALFASCEMLPYTINYTGHGIGARKVRHHREESLREVNLLRASWNRRLV